MTQKQPSFWQLGIWIVLIIAAVSTPNYDGADMILLIYTFWFAMGNWKYLIYGEELEHKHARSTTHNRFSR
jgi:Sec-independent protein secretion pathway component TatC